MAYALAGTLNIDFEKDPIGKDKEGKDVFLKDIWPSNEEIKKVADEALNAGMYKDVYEKISKGTDRWNGLQVPVGKQYSWRDESTYIHDPPFFKKVDLKLPTINDINDAYCLANLGDSITTDHISPAGNIAKNSPAGRYLQSRGVEIKDFNTYGARRGTFNN